MNEKMGPKICQKNVSLRRHVESLNLQAARPLISVYSEKGEVTGTTVSLPAVFKAPIRPDLVSFVHSEMRKNSRQPYAVSSKAGGLGWSRRPWNNSFYNSLVRVSDRQDSVKSCDSFGQLAFGPINKLGAFCWQAIRQVPNPGELAVPWRVFLASVEVVLTDPVRVPSATCAVAVACLRQPRPGGVGTGESMSNRSAMPSALRLQPLESPA